MGKGIIALWDGVATGIMGTFQVIGAAVKAFFLETIIPALIAIGEVVMKFLIALAEAAADTIFGIPYAIAILAGVALLAAAIGSLVAFAFAEGGLVKGPVFGMVGEAGPELIVPLDRVGDLGGGRGGNATIILEWDGTPVMRYMTDKLPEMLRIKGVPA